MTTFDLLFSVRGSSARVNPRVLLRPESLLPWLRLSEIPDGSSLRIFRVVRGFLCSTGLEVCFNTMGQRHQRLRSGCKD